MGLLDGRVEVKTWRPDRYPDFFCELSQYSRQVGRWIDSGLNVTEAASWALVGLDDSDSVISVIVVPTDKLRRLIEGRPIIDACIGSKNVTRGVKLPASELVHSA